MLNEEEEKLLNLRWIINMRLLEIDWKRRGIDGNR